MTVIYSILGLSLALNIFLTWYNIKVLRKLLYVSENISDLFLILRSFQVFIKGLHSMDSYHGEPMVQELIWRVKEILDELEGFRDVFAITLDDELEEELNAAEEDSTSTQ